MNFSSLKLSRYDKLNGGNIISLAVILTKIWQFKGFLIILLFVIETIILNRIVWNSRLEQIWNIKIL